MGPDLAGSLSLASCSTRKLEAETIETLEGLASKLDVDFSSPRLAGLFGCTPLEIQLYYADLIEKNALEMQGGLGALEISFNGRTGHIEGDELVETSGLCRFLISFTESGMVTDLKAIPLESADEKPDPAIELEITPPQLTDKKPSFKDSLDEFLALPKMLP